MFTIVITNGKTHYSDKIEFNSFVFSFIENGREYFFPYDKLLECYRDAELNKESVIEEI